MKDVYTYKYFQDQENQSYISASYFIDILLNYFLINSAVDFGCGHGSWLRAIKDRGISHLTGIDGPWNNGLAIKDLNANFLQIDLTVDNLNIQKFDVAICVEVAEHINEIYSDKIVHHLTSSSDAVIFSAAFVNQGGTCHINENYHSYWAHKFEKMGFIPFDIFRPLLWDIDSIGFWYRQNCFLYIKAGSEYDSTLRSKRIYPLNNFKFMDCIHPELYNLKCGEGVSFKKTVSNIIPSFMKALKRKYFEKFNN